MKRIDLINLLEEACGDRCNPEYNPCAYKEAARELREMEPVAWLYNGHLHECDPSDWAESKVKPLYALGDEK